MKVAYYPGCSLRGTARDYEQSIKAVCEMLSIELSEIEDWNCCGATAAHSLNRKVSIELPARNIAIAQKSYSEMVVPCPLCFNRLKTAQKELQSERKEKYEISVSDKIRIWDLAQFLAQPNILNLISEKVQNHLKDLRVVCYYGCMASRPPSITDEKQWEDPMSMDIILQTLGAEVIQWSHKTDCCGASHLVSRPDLVYELVFRLLSQAKKAGADCIVVSCQMCQANLDIPQERILKEKGENFRIPIIYFTELLGISMMYKDCIKWLKKHFVDPMPVLKRYLKRI